MALSMPWEIDVDARGLEIGPLDKPRLPKGEYAVSYVDHLPTEQLAAKYRDDPNVGDVCPVDIVWAGQCPIAEAVGGTELYDYVVASHVIEHVPDPVGWLKDLSTILRPGGFIALLVPDKRYCFDIRRDETPIWDLVEAHLREAKVPSLRQIYEFTASMVAVDTAAVWRGDLGFDPNGRTDVGDVDRYSLSLCRDQLRSGGYVDVHCWAFTPESFVDVYDRLSRLDLVDLALERIEPTPFGGLEFYVTLRKLPSNDVAERQLLIERARSAAAAGPQPDRPAEDRLAELELAVAALRDQVNDLAAPLTRVDQATTRVMSVLRRVRHPVQARRA